MKKIYSGKAKDIFEKNENEVVIYFKDDATAGNGAKHAIIEGKGILNNKITDLIFKHLMSKGIETHFISKLSDREQLVKKVTIIPLEVILRNYSAGSFSKRYGVEEGKKFKEPTFEISYKEDALNDPLLNKDHAIAMEIVDEKEYKEIKAKSKEINKILTSLFERAGIILVDFKLEFGKDKDGKIVLADEFSPDNCRLWDSKTLKKLDKDNFRNDLGNLISSYEIVLERLTNVK